MEYAHCVSYRLHRGAIPAGKMLMHSCDNRLCINPWHLTPGTNKENLDDCVRKGRHRAAVLTAKDVVSIRKSNASDSTLAVKYGVTARHIRRIRNFQRWS